jgi:hypothetical protein
VKLTEVIDQLTTMRSEHGDIEIMLYGYGGQTIGIWGIEYNDDQAPEVVLIVADDE